MTSGFFTRRLALLAAVSSALLLAACGGDDKKDSGGQSNLRAINLTTDLASVDLYTGDTKRFSALTADAMAASTGLETGTYTLAVKRAGETATLYSESFALAKDRHYSAVITGRESSLLVRTIPENEDTAGIAAANFKLRVFNLTADTGGVDVYVTLPTVDIDASPVPTLRFTNNSLSDFLQFESGNTYRLRVTGTGNSRDVRLDIPLSGVVAKQYHTLVLTSGPGGALMNAALIPQSGTASILKNTKARVRVAAGVAGAANVSASVNAVTIVAQLRSPGVMADYELVNAGTQDLTVLVNGTTVSTGNRTFAAGADYTVLASGSAVTTQVQMLTDDNRLPATSTQAKVRLVNGVAGSAPMTVSLDFKKLLSDVAAGTASTYYTAASTGSARLEVSTLNDFLFATTAVSGQPLLKGQGVYTVFMLGGQAAPAGFLRQDR